MAEPDLSLGSPPSPTESQSRVRRPRRWLFLVSHDRVHPACTGGDALVVLLAEALAARGDEVALWTSRAPGRADREVVQGVSVRRFTSGPLLAPSMWAALLGGGAGGADRIVEQVICSQRIPFLARLLSPRPTVGVWYQDNVPLFRAQYGGGPSLALAKALQRWLLLVNQRGALLTCSGTSRAWLLEHGVDRKDVEMLYPRVPLPAELPSSPPFEGREDRFAVIGNFRPTKRFEEAVEVLRALRERVPSAKLTLMGRANDLRYLRTVRELVARSGLERSIEVLVDRGDREKFELLGRCKALTVHSPIEGFGWTVIEAGAMGTPAVVNPGTPEDPLGSGPGAVRVRFGDVAGYARALERWMRSAEEWSRASQDARASASRYTGSALTPELARFLDALRR